MEILTTLRRCQSGGPRLRAGYRLSAVDVNRRRYITASRRDSPRTARLFREENVAGHKAHGIENMGLRRPARASAMESVDKLNIERHWDMLQNAVNKYNKNSKREMPSAYRNFTKPCVLAQVICIRGSEHSEDRAS